ncbi:hypothetical protein DL766_004654 [Monosporascus sp. MC13-8B]|uniref:C4-dicarboxylate transporter/malic acid transport protein n=1 Tax=Monosporascus cannonballus TaxID=155416 RepID=A0ABY0HEQ6_9PEZI|nr:hypothetical protein DL763_008468 [Monosporascus cannonballus]RYO91443.1 hypothetical protein DL762_002169 [Monosporascus cannonballus]RYP30935.1 hypothetical protein DL766_004654 [Monosporascus sp. MC13-8B]
MPGAVSSERAHEPYENGYVTPREEHFESGGGFARPTNRGRDRSHTDSVSGNGFFQAHDPDSLARMISNARKDRCGKKIGIRDRICCYQWTWFTMTMATGGIANVFHSSKMVPGSFTHSFTDQVESLFIPAVFVSTGTILINVCEFGIPYVSQWLVKAMLVLFWVYGGVCMIASAAMYLVLWSTQVFPIHTMTPVWVFPAYPLLLTAPFAGNLIQSAVSANEHPKFNFIPMAFCAVAIQGTGFLISFMICAAFIYRLMTQKLPRDTQRPGVFISVGPSGFTVAGLVLLGQKAEVIVPASFGSQEHAVLILRIISNLVGLWLWGLSVWFFLVSVGSLWKYVRPERSMPFQMTWWSFVFPNTALVTATLAMATALDSAGLRVFGCVMAACLTIVWLLVFVTMLRCLWKRQLLWPKELDSR